MAGNRIKLNAFRPNDATSVDVLDRWVSSLGKPAAVFCANDTCATVVLQACHRAGIDVPTGVSILGVDDDEYLCNLAHPTLSSVRPDFESEGFQAALELSRLMEGKPPSKSAPRILAAGIIERASTRYLSPATLLVNRGREFIRLNARRNLTVSAVVAHLGVSRRLADLRFRQIANKSILQVITDYRLEAVKEQLSKTSASIAAIARVCGFSSPAYLQELFKKHCGMTMRAYRLR